MHRIPSVSDAPSSRHRAGRPSLRAMPYIIGNGTALLLGLVLAYVALRSSAAVSVAVNSLKISDFMSYYSALRLIHLGQGSSIYTFNALHHMQIGLMQPLKMPVGFQPYYLYPPYFAILLSPLAALSFDTAYFLWTALNCVLLASSLYLLEQHCDLGKRASFTVRCAGVCFLPVFVTLLQGQVSILILFLVVLAFSLLGRGESGELLAGVVLAFAVLKPQYIFPVLLVLVIQHRWRTLLVFGTTGLVLLGAPMLVLGLPINWSYIGALRAASTWSMHARFVGFGPQGNQSFAGTVQQFLPALPASIAFITLFAAALGLLCWVAVRSQRHDIAFAMAIVVGLLISPHVFIYDLTLLLLPVAVVLRNRPRVAWPLGVGVGIAYCAIFVGYRLAFSFPVHLSVVLMITLCLWLSRLALRQVSATSSVTA